jgi:hypothetical protein
VLDLWKLQDFSPGEGVARHVFAEQFDTSEWIDITAPEDVYHALIEASRIEDPFYETNSHKALVAVQVDVERFGGDQTVPKWFQPPGARDKEGKQHVSHHHS